MKKYLAIVLALMMVLAMALVACQPQVQPCDKHVDANGDLKCDVCGEKVEKPADDPCKDGHSYEGGVCTVCGAEDPNYVPPAPNAVAVPVVTIDAKTGIASWTAVQNASKYVYKINGGAEQETTQTYVQLAIDDKIVVKAIAATDANVDSAFSAEKQFLDPTVYGLPAMEEGYYITDSDVLQASATERYILFSTNSESGEQDNVIAITKGELKAKGWAYGEPKVVLEPSADGWDKYLGSASIVKGNFALAGENYEYLMAYSATAQEDNFCQSIGLAVSKTIDGEYVRVGNAPVLAFDKAVYGNMAGHYAPSLVNKDGASSIGLFYTRAYNAGHFLYFATADMSNLDNISLTGSMVTNKGDLASGDAVQMMPNMDVALGADGYLYAVKDQSPSAGSKPAVAIGIEYAKIALAELGTTDDGDGWVSIATYDNLDTDDGYERIYSPSLVSDLYGHTVEVAEIIYNVCDTLAANEDYVFSQKLLSIVVEL